MTTTQMSTLKRSLFLLALSVALLCLQASPVWSQDGESGAEDAKAEKSYKIPHRYGMAVSYGHAFGLEENPGMVLVSAVGLFDYDRIWPHRSPEDLRFKVELTGGTTTHPDVRAVLSANILALYYLSFLSADFMVPYFEAGIGGIYTDYQVDGQGSRVNFNPVVGLGMEFPNEMGPDFFTSVRLHHFSNAGLLPDNQGVNSVLLQTGLYF